jgi:hypothetical protein
MLVRNHFEKGQEGWCSYDYHACIVANAEVNILATHRKSGGPNNGPYIWVDHCRWSTDTPERPISILPLYTYRAWMNLDPLDLRGATVSCYLRGDNLDLLGGECYFWANMGGTRWHFSSHPLHISQGEWAAEPNRFTLVNDESKWHLSWPGLPANPRPLDTMLSVANSYGFSFVGFAREVSGRLSMAQFEIHAPQSS